MSNLKSKLWNSSVFSPLMRLGSFFKNYMWREFVFYVQLMGRFFATNNAFAKIRKFKDKYKGERCFIIATGPSLTVEDVGKLKNEFTFGMNSLCLMFDKLGWETTFYGIQDPYVYNKLKESLKKQQNTQMFVGDIIYRRDKVSDSSIPFAVNYLNHGHTYDKLTTGFSRDVSKFVYDGYTITYSLIQIAVYMGFSQIYLLGNDCSYSNDPQKQHFVDYGHYDPSACDATRRILFSYEYAKKYSSNHGFEILNATRGGKLELFRRVDLDDVLLS